MKNLNTEDIQQIDKLFPILTKFIEEYLTFRDIPFDVIGILNINAMNRVTCLHVEYMTHCILHFGPPDIRYIDIPIKDGCLLTVHEYLKSTNKFEYEQILKDKIKLLKEKTSELYTKLIESKYESTQDIEQDKKVLVNLILELNKLTEELDKSLKD